MSANTSKNYLYTHLHLPRIGQSCKASLAEYRSPLLRTMETLTYSPALLTGLSSQKQLLNINFFNNFQTDPHTPAEVITVEVQSKHLQLAQASLEIHAELRGEVDLPS